MLQQVRLKNADSSFFTEAWQLYEQAFPFDERRSLACHKLAMEQEENFVCLSLYSCNRFVGILFYWLLSECVFVEHLAVVESARGRGLGKAALQIVQQYGKPVILEIEPPSDAVGAKRLRFYESAGYVLLPHEHYQLPYQRGGNKLRLLLLSFPCVASVACLDLFEKEYLELVMRYCEHS